MFGLCIEIFVSNTCHKLEKNYNPCFEKSMLSVKNIAFKRRSRMYYFMPLWLYNFLNYGTLNFLVAFAFIWPFSQLWRFKILIGFFYGFL